MRAFLDTSVLVATFYGDHEHHDDSFALFRQSAKANSCTAAHCLLEFYAVATGMPGKSRASPDEALLFVSDARTRLDVVALEPDEYFAALDAAAELGISGGTAYDALIAHCALKSEADAIYTWNTKHFARLGPQVASRVRTPLAI